jgi:hypothetical protein
MRPALNFANIALTASRAGPSPITVNVQGRSAINASAAASML